MARAATCRGAFLIEALVALIVVSMAAAGLFALSANALRAAANALARTEAADIAVAALGRISVETLATLADRYDAHVPGPGYRALASTAAVLPGANAAQNAPVVSIATGPSAGSRQVSVAIFWRLPNEAAPHRAALTTVVAP